ncbi:hypothetical protein E5288_WYG014957 [Bos mutus]|uniref:Uncharacterized protein n=1 Tax=Bos mutus TaxID=72004 RepID=A0A6B0RWC5_9CETA|nr:hypothetical protein [Bos mutus]
MKKTDCLKENEMEGRLQSQDLGKHLTGVEDLLQLHELVEADIAVQAERVRAVSASALRFCDPGKVLGALQIEKCKNLNHIEFRFIGVRAHILFQGELVRLIVWVGEVGLEGNSSYMLSNIMANYGMKKLNSSGPDDLHLCDCDPPQSCDPLSRWNSRSLHWGCSRKNLSYKYCPEGGDGAGREGEIRSASTVPPFNIAVR